jgi:hypothetical protein
VWRVPLQRLMRPLRVVVPGVLGKHPAEVVGAEDPVTSWDLHVFVDEAAESVSSQRLDCCSGVWGSGACGRVLMQRSVRTVRVVVADVLALHGVEMAWSGDQDVVEAFAAQGADEAFGDAVGSRCPDRGAEDADVGAGEHRVEGGG